MKRFLCGALSALMLCGCSAAPAPTTMPETTVPATTAAPVLKAGYYVPVNEEFASMLFYIRLLEDGSGMMSMMGAEHELTWTAEEAVFGENSITPTADGLLLHDIVSYEFTYAGDSLPEGFLPEPPAPGVYIVSSVGRDGDIDFYGAPSLDNGYLEIREDDTGLLVFDETEYPFTLDGATACFDGWNLMLLDLSQEDPDGVGMVTVYVLDGPIRADSIVFRLMEGEA